MTMTPGENRGVMKNKRDDDDLNQEEECKSIKPNGRYIPVELVGMILQRLSVTEAVRLSCLCKSWRATAPLFDPTLRKAPWMLTFTFTDDSYRLRSAEKQKQSFVLRLPDFSPRTTFCCGSWYGWLLLYHEKSLILFNPFSRARVDLPDIYAPRFFPPHMCLLAYMSAPPTDPDCILIARFHGIHTLHAWRPGESGWTMVDDPSPFFLTYALIRGRRLLTFHPNDNRLTVLQFFPLKTTTLAVTSPVHISRNCCYLVEFFGDMLLVVLDLHRLKFQMFRINLEEGESWVEVKDIGNQALFLNRHKHGFLVTAAEVGWLSNNCIYFTPFYWNFSYLCDWYVYSLEKQTSRCLGGLDWKGEFDELFWITPSLV